MFTAWFPVKQYLVSSMHRGGPFQTETNEHKPQFILVYWVFMVSSVCMDVLVAFYRGLPVQCFYRTVSFLTAPRGHGFTVFVKINVQG